MNVICMYLVHNTPEILAGLAHQSKSCMILFDRYKMYSCTVLPSVLTGTRCTVVQYYLVYQPVQDVQLYSTTQCPYRYKMYSCTVLPSVPTSTRCTVVQYYSVDQPVQDVQLYSTTQCTHRYKMYSCTVLPSVPTGTRCTVVQYYPEPKT